MNTRTDFLTDGHFRCLVDHYILNRDKIDGYPNYLIDRILEVHYNLTRPQPCPSNNSNLPPADPLLSEAQLLEEQTLLEAFDICDLKELNTGRWAVAETDSLLSPLTELRPLSFSSQYVHPFELNVDFMEEMPILGLLIAEEISMDISVSLNGSKPDTPLQINNNSDEIENLNVFKNANVDSHSFNEGQEVEESSETNECVQQVSPLKVLKSVDNWSDANMNLLGANDSNAYLRKSDIFLKNPPHLMEITFKSKSALIVFKSAEGNKVLDTQIVLYPNMKVKKPNKQIHKVLGIELIPLDKSVDYKLLLIHTHLGSKIYLCPANCMRAYMYLMEAKLHSLKHLNVKPYKCDHPNCVWKFYTPCKLARHKQTHEKVKNFICSVCDRSFTTMYNLNQHKKKHDRPAILQCPVSGCNSMFQTEKQCLTHCNKTHKQCDAPYYCGMNKCTLSFFSKPLRDAHQRNCGVRGKRVICTVCSKWFSTPYRLTEHSRQHTGVRPYQCQYENCTWSFTTASKLKRHLGSHLGERNFHCEMPDCKKSFLRSEHLKEHTMTHIVKSVYVKGILVPDERRHYVRVDPTDEDPEASAVRKAAKADELLQQAIRSIESENAMHNRDEM